MRRSVALVVALGLAVFGLVGCEPPPPEQSPLPAGFRLTESPSGQAPYDLTGFAYLPDGSALTTGKGGNVAWVGNRWPYPVDRQPGGYHRW